LQLTLVLGASVLIGILVIPCVLVAIGGSAAVGQTEEEHFRPVLIGGATIAATIVPLIGMAWLAWLIDAPPHARHAVLPRRISLTALALMALIGGVLGTDMLREEIAVTRETAARYQQMDAERAAMTRAGFAKLTDADPLRNWLGYTDRFTPDDNTPSGVAPARSAPDTGARPDCGAWLVGCGVGRRHLPRYRGRPVPAVCRVGSADPRLDWPARRQDPHGAPARTGFRLRHLR